MNDETKAEASQVRAGQRIAKVMARVGVCSRREAEAWIAEGRVSVNGELLLSPAFNVSEADDVRVDGKRLGAAERTRLFLFHKPRGFVTTARDPEGRATVFAALPPGLPRVVAVGRLDINTEGLLLLTNDGGLARVLELPSTGWLRRYRVRAHGTIDQAALDALGGGITIDGVDYMGIEARLDREQGSNVWITLGLREGKNREIKKVLEHLGLAVNRLIRVSFGPFELGDLAEGEAAEVRTRVLRDQLGAKLAKEAQADFDAPLNAHEPETPVEPRAEEREARGASRPHERSERDKAGRDGRRGPGQVGRDGRGKERERRFDPDAAAPRPPPTRSTHEPRRKHVSRLRAEIAADAATTRKRIERSATHDRKGRTIAVERLSPSREEARRRAAAETERPRTGRPKAAGRDRPPRSGKEGGRRAEFEPRGRRGEPASERPADRKRYGAGESRSPRAEFKPRGARSDGAGRSESGARERASDRPPGRKREGSGESRPPRAEFKPRGPRADRAGRRESGAREHAFDRPPGRKREGSGESRSPRSEFKQRGPRAETRGDARPARRFDRSADRQTGGRESDRPQRARPSPGRSARPPGKGPPKGRGGPRRPPRKP